MAILRSISILGCSFCFVCLKVRDNFCQSVYLDQIIEFGMHYHVNSGCQSFSEQKFESEIFRFWSDVNVPGRSFDLE